MFKKNKILNKLGSIFKSNNPGSNYTKDGKVTATEANSEQMKAMNNAKMKKMEDDKVKEKKKLKEDMKGMSQKSGDKRSTESGAGMTAKGVAKYNRRTGGKLKTAVTTPPSKLKAGSKAANRRKSFCARSKSWDGPRGKAARRRWNCEFEPELPMIPESKKKLYNTSPLSTRVSNWAKGIKEGDTYVKTDRNKFGLPKDLKSVEKKVDKKVTGVNYSAMAQSYVPQGEMIDEIRANQGMGDLAKKMNLDPTKPGDYMKLKRLLRNQGKDKAMLSMGEAKVIQEMPDDIKGAIMNNLRGGAGEFSKGGNFKDIIKSRLKKTAKDVINTDTVKTKLNMGKAKMTSSEKKKKEDYVKGMKKDKGGFTKRYGKDGETVMYATATKMAMKEGSCGEGEYYCNDDQKCKPIPDGYKEGKDGMLVKEAKYEKGASDYGKTSIRNKRAFGKGGNAAPPKERGGAKMIRLDLHKKRRGVKKNNKYGATNKPPVDGAPSDEFKKNKNVKEGNLHKWFKGSKSKDGKGGWVNVVTGGTCASDKPGEGTPKCVSSSKRASMTKAERLSASRRKKKADPGQQSKSGAAKPTYVATDSKKK